VEPGKRLKPPQLLHKPVKHVNIIAQINVLVVDVNLVVIVVVQVYAGEDVKLIVPRVMDVVVDVQERAMVVVIVATHVLPDQTRPTVQDLQIPVHRIPMVLTVHSMVQKLVHRLLQPQITLVVLMWGGFRQISTTKVNVGGTWKTII
jgi:hypothetical protein